jgi:hypothetical protein
VSIDSLDAEASYNVGVANRNNGLKIPSRIRKDETDSNFVAAFNCFSHAAAKDHAQAMFSLGVLYQYGRGTKRDEGQALKWFLKSAEFGNIDVMEHIGSCYHLGIGTPDDKISVVDAYTWYRRAKWNSPRTENGAFRTLTKCPEDREADNQAFLSYLELTYDFPFAPIDKWQKLLNLFNQNHTTLGNWIRDQEFHEKMKQALSLQLSDLSEPQRLIRQALIGYIKTNVQALKIDESTINSFTMYDLLKMVKQSTSKVVKTLGKNSL